jgi:hypothetical protein
LLLVPVACFDDNVDFGEETALFDPALVVCEGEDDVLLVEGEVLELEVELGEKVVIDFLLEDVVERWELVLIVRLLEDEESDFDVVVECLVDELVLGACCVVNEDVVFVIDVDSCEDVDLSTELDVEVLSGLEVLLADTFFVELEVGGGGATPSV